MEKSIKLVWVAGVQVPESKVAGRLKALQIAQERKAMYNAIEAKRMQEETEQLLEQGYTMPEITCLRHANRIKQMEAQGYGTISRCRIGSPLRNRLGTTHEVVENPQLTEAADKLLAENYN